MVLQGRAYLHPLQEPLYDTETFIVAKAHRTNRTDLEIAASELMVAAMSSGHKHKGDINLSGCRFDDLPDGLRVGGDLVLDGCKNLKRLPRHLVVKGILLISYCSSLQKLPYDLKAGGVIAHDTPLNERSWRLVKTINAAALKHVKKTSLTFFQNPLGAKRGRVKKHGRRVVPF